jgi:acyl-coenzyme A synthetase/AMP-(fatty) acid ligase
MSTDIIKSGGFKIAPARSRRSCSAPASEYRRGPARRALGEVVAAAIVASPGSTAGLERELDALCAERPPTQAASLLAMVAALPRNAMGKVMKHEVRALLERTRAR